MTGMTAGSKDFNDTLKSHLPIVFAFVLGLAFILLLVTFRSIVIPIKAIVLNLLSVGAAYGVLTLVFQDGHGEGLLGFHSIGGMTSWLPLFLFVILFGLSMDYHVFILSRIREAVDGGMSTDRAVAHGIKQTAGVVTSAAVVMVAVFAIFATLSSLEFKQMGVGLAAAVLIDATIVRAVLLPATMKLLGDWNWYLPRRLGWLPAARPRAGSGAGQGVAESLLPPHARACGGRRPPRPAPRRVRRGALARRSWSSQGDAICKRVNDEGRQAAGADERRRPRGARQADGRDLRPGDRRHGGARAAGRAEEGLRQVRREPQEAARPDQADRRRRRQGRHGEDPADRERRAEGAGGVPKLADKIGFKECGGGN